MTPKIWQVSKPFEPLAINLCNAKQPSGGSNGCIANSLMPQQIVLRHTGSKEPEEMEPIRQHDSYLGYVHFSEPQNLGFKAKLTSEFEKNTF
jgi:hypothetical protein